MSKKMRVKKPCGCSHSPRMMSQNASEENKKGLFGRMFDVSFKNQLKPRGTAQDQSLFGGMFGRVLNKPKNEDEWWYKDPAFKEISTFTDEILKRGNQQKYTPEGGKETSNEYFIDTKPFEATLTETDPVKRQKAIDDYIRDKTLRRVKEEQYDEEEGANLKPALLNTVHALSFFNNRAENKNLRREEARNFMNSQQQAMMDNDFTYDPSGESTLYQSGGTPEVGGLEDDRYATVYGETGEVARMQNGSIVKIDDNKPNTYDHGESRVSPYGTPLRGVQSFLEATSTKKGRDAKADRVLRVSMDDAEKTTGYRPKKLLSHATLYTQSKDHWDKERKKYIKSIKKATDTPKGYIEPPSTLNSIRLNMKALQSIPSDEDLYNAIYQHQEGVKDMYRIPDEPTKEQVANYDVPVPGVTGAPMGQQGIPPEDENYVPPIPGPYPYQEIMHGSDEYGGAVTPLPPVLVSSSKRNKFANALLDLSYRKDLTGISNNRPDLSDRNPSLKLPASSYGIIGGNYWDLPKDTSKPAVTPKRSGEYPVNIKPNYKNYAGHVLSYLDAMTRIPELYQQVDAVYPEAITMSPDAALQQIDTVANNTLANLPMGTAGQAMAANINSKRAQNKAEVIKKYAEYNAQAKMQAAGQKADIKNKLVFANAELAARYSDSIMQGKAKQSEQKLRAIDSYYKMLTQNEAFNRTANMLRSKGFVMLPNGQIVYRGEFAFKPSVVTDQSSKAPAPTSSTTLRRSDLVNYANSPETVNSGYTKLKDNPVFKNIVNKARAMKIEPAKYP